MYAMATRTIGHGLIAGFRGEPVERSVKSDEPVAGNAEFAGKRHIAVTVPAGVAHVRGGDRRVGVAGAENGVFPVTVGAQRRLRSPFRKSLAVHAGAVLL